MVAQPGGRPPAVAVCVTTRNRAHLLPCLFEGLREQLLDPDSFEVVVVNDGSTDETAEVLEGLAKAAEFSVTVLHHESQQGAPAGRNRAWRAARAPLIAFTDDDCVPTARWLVQGMAGVNAPGIIGMGRVIPNPEQMDRLDPFSYTVWVEEGHAEWFATANLFCSREDLLAVGGFDESLWATDFPTAEDTDLGLRLIQRGATPHFLPRAVVHHEVRRRNFREMLAEQGRWSHIPGLMARYPWARKRLLVGRLFWKPTHPRLLLLLAGLLLASRDRRALLLAVPWLHYRTYVYPLCEGPRRRVFVLPGAAALELVEIIQMARGSIRYRTLVL